MEDPHAAANLSLELDQSMANGLFVEQYYVISVFSWLFHGSAVVTFCLNQNSIPVLRIVKLEHSHRLCTVCRAGVVFAGMGPFIGIDTKQQIPKSEMFLQRGSSHIALALFPDTFSYASARYGNTTVVGHWRPREPARKNFCRLTSSSPSSLLISCPTWRDVKMPKSSRHLKNIVQKGVSTCNYGEKSYFKTIAPRNTLLSTTIF